MSTPSSGSSAYATPTDWVAYYDFRSVGELLVDDKTTEIVNSWQVTQTGQPIYATAVKLLMAAAGLIEAACTKGGNYVLDVTATPPINDLASLIGNSKEFLTEMNVDLAMWKAWKRRPTLTPRELPIEVKAALEALDRLEKGEWIFGLLEKQPAGDINQTIDQPADVQNRNGVVYQARSYFGRRSWERQAPDITGGGSGLQWW